MSNERHYILAHPGPLKLAVGELVSSPQTVAKYSAEGAVFLPVDSEPLHTFKLGGFVRRDWGLQGWPFARNAGEGGAPTVLQVPAGACFIHWAAEVVCRSHRPARGELRLWCDPASARTLNSGLSVVTPPAKFEIKPGTTNVVQGVSRFNGGVDGFLSLGLWGVCDNAGVRWLAVSGSERSS